MKRSLFTKIFTSAIFAVAFFSSVAIAASTGTIDPNGAGQYKAKFLDTGVVSDTAINFGKFTTQSQYNITVSDTALRGYAWGSSVGWIVANCADTTSGCSGTNGNFKVANNAGTLSGYAWGENTGWINFGPFSDPGVSAVKIASNGNFGGTLGGAGYAWSQNYGWIVFDCSNANSCVHTDWTVAGGTTGTSTTGGGTGGTTTGGGSTGGSGVPGGGTTAPTTPPADPAQPSEPTTPSNPPHDTSSTPPVSPADGTVPAQPGDNTPPPAEGPTEAPTPSATQPENNPAQSTNEPGPFGNGLSFPPALNEALNGIVSTIGNTAGAAASTVVAVSTGVLDAARTPMGKTLSAVTTAVGVTTTAAAGTAMLLLANPVSLAELLLLPFRLWTLLLIAFGFKKRNRPWGTVYDSVTKQPIDPAYVMLTDMEGNEVATSITDIDGRYGFAVAAGMYKLVANKTNYEFPSKKLAGREFDELYNNMYFGETVIVKEEGDVITKNIPLDQLNFDWNEFAKNEQKRLSYYKRSDVTIARISNVFFWLGFIVATIALIASHTAYNGGVFLVYVVMLIVRHYSPQFKPRGSIAEMLTDQPMPFAILHVLSVGTGQEITHKVADRLGNYYCLVPNGTYSIVIDRKNADASYTKIPTLQPVTVKEGYLKENFKV